ncbi:phage head-tail joining protein [Pelagimonas varians]|uniref:Uncharacterized protein n=1 Tax=Pelagimonas varians TaxID=696760 RepID=A0A238JYZ1_9RHOB|nr:hypothetical protein [Pelagimonas varians]PYG33115.1 hypothetical protein C8N36_102110 [Pelagimonas varians]SMX35723.1 hypothetical protein PEV8663_00572 [Pelagimonas varians]
MSYTQAQVDHAKAMYAKGALSLELNGEKVTFVSGAEFRRRIREMEAGVSGTGQGMTITFPKTGRGL